MKKIHTRKANSFHLCTYINYQVMFNKGRRHLDLVRKIFNINGGVTLRNV